MAWSTAETSEETWLPLLKEVPRWELPERPTLVVSPHPDDETLGAGGLIALQATRNVPVKILAVSDGEAAYPGFDGLAKIRKSELEAAAAALGVSKHHLISLGLPDSRVSEFEHRLTGSITELIDADSLLVAPWEFDPHPDHQACGRAAIEAAQLTGAAIVFYMFWAWHRESPQFLTGLPLRKLTIPPAAQRAKAEALACHRSQLHHPGGQPILPDVFLAPARRPFEIFMVEKL